ncbi:hypothetical protein B0H66DRAFT_227156 [Apodospora peruviana]|uniref:C2H2-type domain-containing protein n=1 Tax=Apodospora peruviana TaxID=516989 RepID=A0AAE0M530_9PEZI|nr:hypothetical protein B0H66DRAFT_227156 [Apodospora peruviana]
MDRAPGDEFTFDWLNSMDGINFELDPTWNGVDDLLAANPKDFAGGTLDSFPPPPEAGLFCPTTYGETALFSNTSSFLDWNSGLSYGLGLGGELFNESISQTAVATSNSTMQSVTNYHFTPSPTDSGDIYFPTTPAMNLRAPQAQPGAWEFPTGSTQEASITVVPPLTAIRDQPQTNSHQRTPRRQQTSCPVLSAREQRKIERPEKCPVCNKGFQYSADMKKHLKSKHPDFAEGQGISTARSRCQWCPSKTFARPDHLLRHRQRKHGLEKKTRTRRTK